MSWFHFAFYCIRMQIWTHQKGWLSVSLTEFRGTNQNPWPLIHNWNCQKAKNTTPDLDPGSEPSHLYIAAMRLNTKRSESQWREREPRFTTTLSLMSWPSDDKTNGQRGLEKGGGGLPHKISCCRTSRGSLSTLNPEEESGWMQFPSAVEQAGIEMVKYPSIRDHGL